ncbi:MAG TPA: hypothetical protein PK828_10175 [Limnochordia bacterium]|nr:hypothetical protein [Limnochordia bacterium]
MPGKISAMFCLTFLRPYRQRTVVRLKEPLRFAAMDAFLQELKYETR